MVPSVGNSVPERVASVSRDIIGCWAGERLTSSTWWIEARDDTGHCATQALATQ